MSSAEAEHLRLVALRAARVSADYLRSVFRQRMSVQDKISPHDLVTEHDHASEALLRKAILAEVPDSVIIGEEGGALGAGRGTWHGDPIDGTVNFASGIGFWCVSVAAAVDDELVAGVIIDPMAGLEYSADLTAFYINDEQVQRGPAGPESAATLICTFPRFHDLDAVGDLALEVTDTLTRAPGSIRAMGSGSLGLAHVAAGWGDATFDLHTNSWDVAAGWLMVQRAGGRYVGFDRGDPDENPRTAYTRHGYVALGPGADFPVLLDAGRRLSAAATRCICPGWDLSAI